MKGFLGLDGYYKRLVQHYRNVAALLTQLLKLGAWKWTKEAQATFKKLKITMMTLPILAMSGFTLSFEFKTNASSYGVGVVLI